MRPLRLIFGMMFLLVSCSGKMKNDNDNQGNGQVELTGIVDDGFLKRYPFYVKSGDFEWALDIVNLPKYVLGKKCKVIGKKLSIDGIDVLTDVSINGIHYQTNKEWDESNKGPDPFSEDDPFAEKLKQDSRNTNKGK